MDLEHLGRIAREARYQNSGVPEGAPHCWEDLDPCSKEAWRRTASVVAEAVREELEASRRVVGPRSPDEQATAGNDALPVPDGELSWEQMLQLSEDLRQFALSKKRPVVAATQKPAPVLP